MYKTKYITENVGDSLILDIGEVNAHRYKRTKDTEADTPVEDNKIRYRIVDKVNLHGKRFQLNGTLTEITKMNTSPNETNEVNSGE